MESRDDESSETRRIPPAWSSAVQPLPPPSSTYATGAENRESPSPQSPLPVPEHQIVRATLPPPPPTQQIAFQHAMDYFSGTLPQDGFAPPPPPPPPPPVGPMEESWPDNKSRQQSVHGQKPTRTRRDNYSSDSGDSDEDLPVRRKQGNEYSFRPYRRQNPPSIDEDSEHQTLYAFTPSRLGSRSASMFGPQSADTNAAEENLGQSGFTKEDSSWKPENLVNVYDSRYTGDSCLSGGHLVTLTHSQKTLIKYEPLFRWIHITQRSMSFDKFTGEVKQIGNLTGSERKGIADLLARVKKNHVKSIQTPTDNYVQYMEPGYLQRPLPPDGTAKDASLTPRSVHWLCLPYFSLEKYSGLLSADSPTSFPIQTLLQAQLSRATRERDMEQAACENKTIPYGVCFHIAQLWCLVLNNSLLVTCGRMPESTLCADSIAMVAHKPDQVPSLIKTPRVLVSYCGSVLWAIQAKECQTWLAFVSHFSDFWPSPLQFLHHMRPVTVDDWPRMCNLIRYSRTNIVLELRIASPIPPPPNGRLQPLKEVEFPESDPKENQPTGEDAGQSSRKSKVVANDRPPVTSQVPTFPPELHIFECLEGIRQPGEGAIDETALNDALEETEQFLKNSTSFRDRTDYWNCPKGRRVTSYLDLKDKGRELSKSRATALASEHKDHEIHIDIFNAADLILRFFLPPKLYVPTVAKYWGAVARIVRGPEASSVDSRYAAKNLHSILIKLRNLLKVILPFRETLSQVRGVDKSAINVPVQFEQAWLHLVLAMVCFSTDIWRSEGLLSDVITLLKEGMEILVRDLAKKPLLNQSIVLPLELVSLMSLRLLKDVTPGVLDITRTYSSALGSIENDIASKRSNRSLQDRIARLKQEISIVNRTIKSQSLIFDRMFSNLQELRRGVVRTAPAIGHTSHNASVFSSAGMPTTHNASILPNPFAPSSYSGLAPAASYSGLGYENPTYQRYGGYQGSSTAPYRNPGPSGYNVDPGAGREPYTVIPLTGREASYCAPVSNIGTYGSTNPRNPKPRSMAADVEERQFANYLLDQGEEFKLQSTDPGGFRDLFLQECLSQLSKRGREFSEFRLYALQLEEANRNHVENTKDRQERAIYAFTVVTVIFLPLSAVASIFGMNTKDVRDMEFDQWAYWATAVPVTVVVILLGLWWTGEFENMFSWLVSRATRREGYHAIPEEPLLPPVYPYPPPGYFASIAPPPPLPPPPMGYPYMYAPPPAPQM